jgi:MoxR-like ATPase
MEYKKIFNPKDTAIFTETISKTKSLGDRSSKSVYVYNENIILAVNVAIATGRPILVRGSSGWGKSSLARNVAKVLECRYYEKVISSRIQARDLLWEVDMLRRLQDAQTGTLKDDFAHYIKPSVLWWAFDRESAQKQEENALSSRYSNTPKEQNRRSNHPQSVVLLDEIDKAEPDVPNNLLVPLGSLYFEVEETGAKVECKEPPLVIITTNDERDLPPAFLRRCVELQLSKPDLLEIGKAHFGKEHIDLVNKVASLLDFTETESNMDQSSIQSSAPSPAEFIDTVKACIKLKIKPKSNTWDILKKVTVWKHGRTEGG